MTRPTTTTKTAISLPSTLYERLEAVRAERGLTRSGAVAEAVAAYVSRGREDLTARIDAALLALETRAVDEPERANELLRDHAARRVFARLDAEDGPYPAPRAVRNESRGGTRARHPKGTRARR